MRVLLGALWGIMVFTTAWVLAANALFPWIDRKREQRQVFPTISLDDILNGKAGNDDRAQR